MKKINWEQPIVFLDVGTHDGHTLEEVTSNKYNFYKIYGFEPMPQQYINAVNNFGAHHNVELFNFGLSDTTGKANLFGSNNNLGTSIYNKKNDVEKDIITECDLVETSQFFKKYISTETTVVVKLNCEGAEIPILNNLINSGEIWKISNVLIDFDIRKVTGMEYNEKLLLDRLAAIGFENYSLSDAFVGTGPTHQIRIGNWLKSVGVPTI